jgi:hypothetical protein
MFDWAKIRDLRSSPSHVQVLNVLDQLMTKCVTIVRFLKVGQIKNPGIMSYTYY